VSGLPLGEGVLELICRGPGYQQLLLCGGSENYLCMSVSVTNERGDYRIRLRLAEP
jgi:hypothetical protein